MRGYERPGALEAFAVQMNGQPAVALLLDELVRAVVPDLDGARAVVPLRDLAREGRVVEWMIFDVHGERSLARLERHALRHRPRRERAAPLEAEVVVEPPRVMALDDEDRILRPPPFRRERLGGLLRVALAVVLAELGGAHEAFLAFGRAARFLRCVRSTDSRNACIRSTTSPPGSAGSGRGTPSAFWRMSSMSSVR